MDRNKETDLSIIVPVYNGEKYIERLLTSIAENNPGDVYSYEIILVNDGSSDNSGRICRRFRERWPQVRYSEKNNEGIASARNVGLREACGTYITFADQDDIVVGSYGPFLSWCTKESPDLLITSPLYKEQEQGECRIRSFRKEIITDKKKIKDIAAAMIDAGYLVGEDIPRLSNSVWNVLYKRKLLEENSICFKTFIDYEDDWIFSIETLLQADKIAISDQGYYCWMARSESESHRAKYIPNLIQRRKQWMHWLNGILDQMELDRKTRRIFTERVLMPRNILISFKNACWKPNASEKEMLGEIRDAVGKEGWDISRVNLKTVDEIRPEERFLLGLLKLGFLRTAFYMNSGIWKLRFH